jgi:hypothetical protein
LKHWPSLTSGEGKIEALALPHQWGGEKLKHWPSLTSGEGKIEALALPRHWGGEKLLLLAQPIRGDELNVCTFLRK